MLPAHYLFPSQLFLCLILLYSPNLKLQVKNSVIKNTWCNTVLTTPVSVGQTALPAFINKSYLISGEPAPLLGASIYSIAVPKYVLRQKISHRLTKSDNRFHLYYYITKYFFIISTSNADTSFHVSSPTK